MLFSYEHIWGTKVLPSPLALSEKWPINGSRTSIWQYNIETVEKRDIANFDYTKGYFLTPVL